MSDRGAGAGIVRSAAWSPPFRLDPLTPWVATYRHRAVAWTRSHQVDEVSVWLVGGPPDTARDLCDDADCSRQTRT